MDARHEKSFQDYNYSPNSPSPSRPRFEQQQPHSSGQHRQQYSPPPFHKIWNEARDTQRPGEKDMNGIPLHAYRAIYDNAWQMPQSPPQTNDTTRSRLADEQLVRPGGRPPQRRAHWDKEPPRVVRYRSPSAGYSSDDSYDRRRRSRNNARSRAGRSRNGSRAGSKVQQPAQQPAAEQKTGLEAIITPLRLGILLGCFDIIGGSLSVWMTRKRFGKAAQQATAAPASGGGQQQKSSRSEARSRTSQRASSRRGEESRSYHPYDSGSETDSDYSERQRRTAEHVREQRRLEYERDRGLGRPPREALHNQYGRRR